MRFLVSCLELDVKYVLQDERCLNHFCLPSCAALNHVCKVCVQNASTPVRTMKVMVQLLVVCQILHSRLMWTSSMIHRLVEGGCFVCLAPRSQRTSQLLTGQRNIKVGHCPISRSFQGFDPNVVHKFVRSGHRFV